MRAVSPLVSLASVVLVLAACSADSSDCRKMAETICARACACNNGTQCRFVQPPGDATATKTEEGCNQFWEDVCEKPTYQRMDTGKCATEAATAECVPNDNPLDGKALAAQLPESCAEPK